MKILLALLSLIFILQLVYPFCTVLLATLFRRKEKPMPQADATLDFACIITAYKNVEIARGLVDSLLLQTHGHLMVYLVADECPPFDFNIPDPRYVPLTPPEPLRLKAKSLIYAIEHFQRNPDYIAVFDADNLAHPQFLDEVARFAAAGFSCIQGQRTAKNLDTHYAALDSLGEHYKNYIEREVPFRLGGSAVISGSGMATATELYKSYLASPEIEQGKHLWKKMLQEDKILQNFLLRRNIRIAYARKALVYDEKVSAGAAVETQRSRWLFSYFQNIPNALGILRRGLTGFNFNQLYFGLVTLVLPMFIQLGLAMALMALNFFIAPFWSAALFVAIALFILNILWVLYLGNAPAAVWRVVWLAPKFVLRQFTGLFKMINPNKNFGHTEQRKAVSLDEVLGKEPESRS